MFKTPVWLALASALLFGAATPASKFLLTDLSPFQLAGLLYLGAALAVAPAALRGGGLALPHRGDRNNILRLIGAVVFGGILGPAALLFGLRLANAASVSLWLNLELASTAVLGAVVFRDYLGRMGWLGVATAFVASAVLVWTPGTAGLIPGLLVLFACLCWGLDNHLTALIDGITPSQSTFWKGLVAGTVNFTIGLATTPITQNWWLVIIALVVGGVSYGASIVLYIRSAQMMGATRSQVLFASAPFFGALLSVIFLGEQFSGLHLLSTALFALGAALLLMESHAHTHAHQPLTHEHAHQHDDDHHTHDHPESPAGGRHTHPHTHKPVVHRHPHWPDIHHRHDHDVE